MMLGIEKSRAIAPGLGVALAGFSLAVLAGCGGAPLASPPRANERQALQLSAQEREHMRAGMRVFLESIEGITKGVADNKMRSVASSASQSGWGMMDEAAATMALKLPPEFVAISIDTHQKFDDLAAAATAGATKAKVIEDLDRILTNCTSCHAAYRLSPP